MSMIQVADVGVGISGQEGMQVIHPDWITYVFIYNIQEACVCTYIIQVQQRTQS